MNQNEVFYFQTVEIQRFAKGEINCDYLLVSVFVRIFAIEVYPQLLNDLSGYRYKSAPIPDYIKQEIQKKHSDNWQEYLKRY